MDRKFKAHVLVVPITIVIAAIVTILLAVLIKGEARRFYWMYYLIGTLLGLMTHGLLVKQNARTMRYNRIDPEHKVFNPKKSAVLWFLLRFVLMAAVVACLGYLVKDESKTIIVVSMLLAIGGYLTSKIIFIACLLSIREKVKKE